MEKSMKKYISPGGWFSLQYPETWNEFEDGEGSFLFYDPNKWTGNFRISVWKDASPFYAEEVLLEERRRESRARNVKVGSWECVYSRENVKEAEESYVMHLWITGRADTVAECSFTTRPNLPKKEAEEIIASMELRDRKKRYPKELIPIRVVEINEVNEAFEWATSEIRKRLKKDFNAAWKDIKHIQQLIDGGYGPENREAWAAFGITFGTILVNEMDGMEWVTVVDGREEYPALRFRRTDIVVEADRLICERLKRDRKCDLQEEFLRIKAEVEAIL